MVKKRSKLERVAPEFSDLMEQLSKESQEVLGQPIAKTKISRAIARQQYTFEDLFGIGKKKKNKKGQIIADFMVFGVLLLGTVLTVFMLSNFWTDGFSKPLEEIQSESPTDANNATIQKLDATFEGGLDWVLPAAMIILTLGLIGSVFLLDTTPVFFVIMLILAIIFVVVTPMLANFALEVMDDADFATTKSHYPLTFLMVENWVIYIIVTISLTFVAFFAKGR